MPSIVPQPVSLPIDATQHVSALLMHPPQARAGYVLAHGAGAGMTHAFMEAAAQGLAVRGVATLRYNFAYMERGSKRPDTPALAHAAVRAAVGEAQRLLPGLPLVAGGKSFGARMTSQAQAQAPLPGVVGLAFLGFPLHPAGKPATERADHLQKVGCPMWFWQGTRDELADFALVTALVEQLAPRATLEVAPEADHSFHVPARSGRKDADVLNDGLDALVRWIDQLPHA
jgi:predicted alpha/beta-hydrolase family hydrolase